MALRTETLALVLALGIGLSGCGDQESSATGPQAPTARSDSASGPVAGPTARGAAGSWLVDTTDLWTVRFSHESGASDDLLFPEMMGGGVAVFDADGDRDLDLYFVSGAHDLGRTTDNSTAGGSPINRLFLQGSDGRFTDATEASGLGDRSYGNGVAIADYDNDGLEDVFVTNFGPDRLFRGLGGGRFADVTTTSGVGATGTEVDDWSTSAAFCDVDRDGHLDLYVARYVVYEPGVRCTDTAGRREYCGPDSFRDRTDVLLRNDGAGGFQDVTETAGIAAVTGAGLGVVCEDFDDDGWIDIYVANDGDPNQLWMNQRDGTFVDDALIMGTSVNAAGLHEAGMGVVAADFDNDSDFDLFVTHLRDETNTFYRNLGPGTGFEDQTHRVGLGASSTPFTGFGTAPFDLDLDGDLDLAISNGRVKRGERLTTALEEPWNLYAEPNLVYLNDAGMFRLSTAEATAFTAPIEIGRGLATGDLDGDGDLDVVLNNLGGPARIYRSDPPSGHWLIVDAFDPALGRRALGARITLEAGESRQRRTVQGAMSYLSSSDPRAHFGLGAKADPVAISVRWPDGHSEAFAPIEVDQAITLRRGEGTTP